MPVHDVVERPAESNQRGRYGSPLLSFQADRRFAPFSAGGADLLAAETPLGERLRMRVLDLAANAGDAGVVGIFQVTIGDNVEAGSEVPDSKVVSRFDGPGGIAIDEDEVAARVLGLTGVAGVVRSQGSDGLVAGGSGGRGGEQVAAEETSRARVLREVRLPAIGDGDQNSVSVHAEPRPAGSRVQAANPVGLTGVARDSMGGGAGASVRFFPVGQDKDRGGGEGLILEGQEAHAGGGSGEVLDEGTGTAARKVGQGDDWEVRMR